MNDSVILNSPLILIILGIGLVFSLLGLIADRKNEVYPVLSLFLAVGGITYALLAGATLYEAGSVILIFLGINLTAFVGGGQRGDGGK